MSKERDTQFQGFANKEIDKLMASVPFDTVDVDRFWTDDDYTVVRLILAQHAYDLVAHTLKEVYESIDVSDIPDLTKLPEVSNDATP